MYISGERGERRERERERERVCGGRVGAGDGTCIKSGCYSTRDRCMHCRCLYALTHLHTCIPLALMYAHIYTLF